jgi:hypothetical protein
VRPDTILFIQIFLKLKNQNVDKVKEKLNICKRRLLLSRDRKDFEDDSKAKPKGQNQRDYTLYTHDHDIIDLLMLRTPSSIHNNTLAARNFLSNENMKAILTQMNIKPESPALYNFLYSDGYSGIHTRLDEAMEIYRKVVFCASELQAKGITGIIGKRYYYCCHYYYFCCFIIFKEYFPIVLWRTNRVFRMSSLMMNFHQNVASVHLATLVSSPLVCVCLFLMHAQECVCNAVYIISILLDIFFFLFVLFFIFSFDLFFFI